MARGDVVPRDAHYPGRAPIDAYGEGGFRFAEMSHRGSLLCLPSGIYGWPVTSAADLSEATLAPVFGEADAIEYLLIGCGRDIAAIRPELRTALKAHGIAVEALSTGSAIRTYNIMLSEDRRVAAALIAVS